MAKILSKTGISTLQIVRPWHVTQSIDAFLGTDAYDITLSGSMTITGSVLLNGLSTTSQTNVITYDTTSGQLFYTASSAVGGGSINTGSLGNTTISGSLTVTGSTTLIGNTTVSGSITSTGGFTGSLNGTASWAQNVVGGGASVAGNNYEIQFNSASAFQATSSFKFNYLSQSLEQGTSVVASGNSSHAEGSSTQALGIASHAEGGLTYAAGTADHAEGYQTTASSVGWPAGGGVAAAAHAEGYTTKAYGIAAHAEGYATEASSSFSHVEGFATKTTSPYAHAEGYSTLASATASHAEGFYTTASGNYSHAEGRFNEASGEYSHAKGSSSLASGTGSHAEGYQTTSSGNYSHAEGGSNIASGIYAHAQGIGTIASGAASFAGGIFSTAEGDYSIALGYGVTASSDYQTSLGRYNQPANYAFTIGVGSAGSPKNSIAIGNEVEISQSVLLSGSLYVTKAAGTIIQAPLISSSFFTGSTVRGTTGSFSRLEGHSPITIGDGVIFQQPITASIISASSVVGSITSAATASSIINENILQNNYYKLALTNDSGWASVSSPIEVKNNNKLSFNPNASHGWLRISGSDGSFNYIGKGQITASSDISSSGNFYANRFTAAGYISTPLLTHASTPIEVNQHLSGSSTVTASFGHGSFHQATLTNTTLEDSILITTTEDSSTAGPVITLKRNSASPDDGDYLGQIKFKGENDNEQEVVYAKITGKISDASDTTEDGIIEYALQKAGSNTIVSRLTSTDLKLLNGTGLEVNGNISTDGTASAAYFSGDGSNLTNLQRPITSSAINFSASADNAGYYFRTGGNVTCSIQTNANVPIPVGTEFEFFQTSSAGYLLFETGSSSITLNSKSGKMKLAGQFSGATLKKVGTDEFDLIGDLG